MMKCIRDDKGHYIVEASIIVPFVLALVITVGSMCRGAGIKENIICSSADEMKYALINSYIVGTDVALSGRLEKRLSEENKDIRGLDVYGFRSGFTKNGIDELLKIKVDFGMEVNTPIPLRTKAYTDISLTGRKFVGDKSKKVGFGFSNMEKIGEADIVYLFPDDGIKYHKKDCTYVQISVTEMILSETVRAQYSPCGICDADNIRNGNTVYIFKSYGKMYHKKNCRTIEKNVAAVERDIAEEKGYTPCSKCGG